MSARREAKRSRLPNTHRATTVAMRTCERLMSLSRASLQHDCQATPPLGQNISSKAIGASRPGRRKECRQRDSLAADALELRSHPLVRELLGLLLPAGGLESDAMAPAIRAWSFYVCFSWRFGYLF